MSKSEIKNIVDNEIAKGRTLIDAIIVVANTLNHEQPTNPVLYYQQLVGGE